MGQVFCSSCCHRRAKLHVGDKLLNFGFGAVDACKGGARWMSHEHLSNQEKVERLTNVRITFKSFVDPGYEKAVKGAWRAEEREVPRSRGAGGKVLVRMHRPMSQKKGLPLIISAHGGGLVLGTSRDSYVCNILKMVSARAEPELCWASVEYRLAPEVEFTEAVDDFLSAIDALRNEALATEFGYSIEDIHLVGVSAGGFIVLHAVSRLGGEAKFLKDVAALYPMVDGAMTRASYQHYSDLSVCPGVWIRLCWEWALGGVTEERLRQSSLLHSDLAPLKGLKVLLMAAQYDLMHDDAVALKGYMEAHGLDLTFIDAKGSHAMAHMFDSSAKLQMCTWLQSCISA